MSHVTDEKERKHREDDEAQVEDLDPAEDVPDPAQGDHQHGQHHGEPHQHPEQVAGIAGGERVELNAAEDVG